MGDFNFFKPYISVRRAGKGKLILSVIAVLLFFFLIGFVVFNLYTAHKQLLGELTKAEAIANSPEMLAISQKHTEVTEQYNTLKEYQQRVANIKTQVANVDTVTTAGIAELTNLLPPEVTFTKASFATEGITFQGSSPSRDAIAELLHNLKNANYDVTLDGITLAETDSNYTFNMQCTKKGGK